MSKLCVDKLCVDKLCVSKVCVDKFCMDKLCVSKCGQVSCVCELWRRRAAGGGQEKAGVQNQKQEPHTKMWGKSKEDRSLCETCAYHTVCRRPAEKLRR